jgi:Cu/Ag efflux protein CusF
MNFFIHQLKTFFLIQAVVLNFAFAADTQSTPAPVDSASSMQWVRAEIRKIDPENSKVTLRHEALIQLSMGAMTMVFRVDDVALLKQFAVGDRVKFIPDSRAGQLFVTDMKKDD